MIRKIWRRLKDQLFPIIGLDFFVFVILTFIFGQIPFWPMFFLLLAINIISISKGII